MRKFGLIASLVLITNFLMPLYTPVAAAEPETAFAKSRVIVKFKTTSSSTRDSIVRGAKGRVAKNIAALDTQVLEVPAGQEVQAISQLQDNSLVEFAEPDYAVHATALPNDPNFTSKQWGLENTGQNIASQVGKVDADIDAPTAWNTSTGNGVKVAVLDSGISQNHEDLSGKIVAQKNFSGTDSVDDSYGHGTHVSGIIAATHNNGKGVTGTCPGCLLINAKVLDNNGNGFDSQIADGIIWATDNGAKVINMSLGGPGKTNVLENAITYAWNKGVVLVASAGNSGKTKKEFPAAYPKVIAVASTDNKDRKSSFSTYGADWVDITAPGSEIFSTFPNRTYNMGGPLNYGYMSGTSMAAPMVSATAALVWTSKYGTSPKTVRARLEATTDKISGTGSFWANGRLNAANAVAK